MTPPKSYSILVVDDESDVGELVCRQLTAEGYQCRFALNGDEALRMCEKTRFDLVICDIMMPGMSGMDLLMMITGLYPDTAVIMVTAVDDRNTAVTALQIGAYGYVIKPFGRNELSINVAGALERRRLSLLSKQYEEHLETLVDERTTAIRSREEEIVIRLMAATGLRHDETGAHIRRVGLYAYEMALLMGWSREEARKLRLAAPMHDIGKIGIPDYVLNKPGSLTQEEFELMTKHTEIGARILAGSDIPMVQMARDIALSHHERSDGSGYPRGLFGDQIPQSAAITAIVDVYDALSHERVYRPAFPESKTLEIIRTANGSYFGHDVFDCFMTALPILRKISDEVDELGDHAISLEAALTMDDARVEEQPASPKPNFHMFRMAPKFPVHQMRAS